MALKTLPPAPSPGCPEPAVAPGGQAPALGGALPPEAGGLPAGARNDVRQRLLRLRAQQPPALAASRSRAAQRRLLASPVWRAARAVALYVGVKGELATDLLLAEAWGSGRTVWLPRVRRGQPGRMDFVACAGAEALRPGPFGLREPDAALPGLEPGDRAFTPDAMLLPGVAFDGQGGRMGYGGGYYDRFLQGAAPFVRIGLCFDFQLVETLPLAPWDQRVHYLCTEERLLCL